MTGIRNTVSGDTDNTQYIENFVNRVKDGLSEEEVEMVRQEIGKTPPVDRICPAF